MGNKNWGPVPRSLSFQLSILTTLIVLFLILAFWFFLYARLQSQVEEEDRQAIEDRVHTIRSLLSVEDETPERLKRRVELEWASRKFERFYVRIRSENGTLITQTPDISSELSEQFRNLDEAPKSLHKSTLLSSVDVGNITFKLIRARVTIQNKRNNNYIVDIALERTGESKLLRIFRASFLFVFLLGFPACFAIAQVLVRKSLAGIQEISAIASRVNSSRLQERVQLGALPQEFHEMANTINNMLNRLSISFQQLNRFSDDMAHELRTPINNMLGVLSLALTKPRANVEYINVISSSVEDCDRLKRIVDALLFIARSSDPKTEIKKEILDLKKELTEIVDFYEPLGSLSGIRIDIAESEAYKVWAERTLFQRAISNILANAIRYSPAKGIIKIIVEVIYEKAYISVIDEGEGIEPKLLRHVGERFFRVDGSRSQELGGHGLGLSIVKSIMQMHGGQLQIANREPNGLKVSLDFDLYPKDEQTVILNT